MDSESSNYEIKIATQYDGSGAKAAQEDLTRTSEAATTTGAAAPAGGGAVGAANAAAHQAAFDKYAASVAAEDAREISAEQQKAILVQQRQIVSLRGAQVLASINGDDTEVKRLGAVAAVRQNTLQTLRLEVMTQEELNGFLAEQVALENAASVAVRNRAVADTEAAAAGESGKVHGRAGHMGHLAENFGLDSNYAISMGMGVMFGMEAYRLIQDATKELEKQTAEREKQGKELSEQLKKNHEDLNNARSLNDVAVIRERIEKELTDLHQKRWEIDLQGSAEEKDALDNRINALNNELRIAATWPAANLERKNAEEKVEESIKSQTKALDEQLGKYKEEVEEIKSKLKFENELADLKLKERLLQIDVDERDGKISHEKAAQQRGAVSGESDDSKFKREQAAKKEELDKAEAAKILAENSASAVAAGLASAKMHRDSALNQLSGNAVATSEADKANEAAKKASDAAAWSEEGSRVMGGKVPNFDATRKANEEAARAAAEAAKKVLPANQVEQLKKDAESQEKQVKDLEKQREEFEKKAQAAAEDYAKKKKAYDTEVPHAATLQQHRVIVRGMEDRNKSAEGASQDQREREREQREAERATKSETPEQLAADTERLFREMSESIHKVALTGSAKEPEKLGVIKRVADSIANHLASNPKDTAAQAQLAAILDSLERSSGLMATVFEQSGIKDNQSRMTRIEANQKRLEDQLKNQRTRH